ncbi:GNAT family N-acetyltransferase [Glutamicibacter sp.]|uniref:GNAT family N-acetyltransferase n=1 Tax=Glutamicibacter sp. TaxID=1931995 RepID=UPI002B46C2C7|nr:GNAT family N-acetyltransferase [Glutamicibacter sp.]HJX78499.1 GNAT family N-acetyltransferase [Glutamicibacter sp.]
MGRRDTAALLALLDQDPVVNIFTRSQLALHRSAVPDGFAHLLGINGEDGLESACWVGANIAPTAMTDEHARAYAQYALDTRQRFASVFGPAQTVLAMREVLATGPQDFFDVRENQPMMSIRRRSEAAAIRSLRVATLQDFDLVLPASAAMFEEELGYSPLENGGGYYRSRVRQLIREGHTLIDTDEYGEIIFKADLGTVTTAAVQIQGVWISPRHRGQGLSTGYMAATVAYALRFAPTVSLYVNDFNLPAIRSYERVGFEQVGTFATILF